MRVTNMKIKGSGKNLYLVNWYYVANHGVFLTKADSEEEARKMCIYGDKVTFLITKISEDNLPVVFEGESMRGEI